MKEGAKQGIKIGAIVLAVLVLLAIATIYYESSQNQNSQSEIEVSIGNQTMKGLNENWNQVEAYNEMTNSSQYLQLFGYLQARNGSEINYGQVVTTSNISKYEMEDKNNTEYQFFSNEDCELQEKHLQSKEENICLMCGENQVQCYQNGN